MRRRDEVDKVLQVARKWENYATRGEQATEEKQLAQKRRPLKRKETADPPATSRPQKHARTRKTSPHPPLNTIPVTAQTSQGKVTIHVEVRPGESELDYELRVSDLIDAAEREADKETIALLRARQVDLQVAKGTVPRPGVSPPLPSHSVPPPSPGVPEKLPIRAPSPTFSRSPLSPLPFSSATAWLRDFEARIGVDDDDDWPIPLAKGPRPWSSSPSPRGALTPTKATTPVRRPWSHSPRQGGASTPARVTTPLHRSCSPSQNWQDGAAGATTPVQDSCSLFTAGVAIIAPSPSRLLPAPIPLFLPDPDSPSPWNSPVALSRSSEIDVDFPIPPKDMNVNEPNTWQVAIIVCS